MRSRGRDRPAVDTETFRPLEVTDRPEPADIALLEDKVIAAAVAVTGQADVRELAVWLRDDNDCLRAGVSGWTWGRCCELQYLWVDEPLTGRGLGRQLMEAAEEEARRRGCVQVVLFTFDAQAAAWYPRLGYSLVGTVEGYPTGGTARWLRKLLDRSAGG